MSFQTEGKFKSRPDSGIAVSMSSGSYSSYSSSEATKEPRDDIDEACHTESSDILVDRIDKVRNELLTFILIMQCICNLINCYPIIDERKEDDHRVLGDRRHLRVNGQSGTTATTNKSATMQTHILSSFHWLSENLIYSSQFLVFGVARKQWESDPSSTGSNRMLEKHPWYLVISRATHETIL